METPRTPEEGLAFLASRSPSTVVLGLERMRQALEELGHPELRLRSVQVSGTNGKGSTCAFLESILRAAGHRVGLYTSPHLVRVNERFVVGGVAIDDQTLGTRVVEVLDKSPAAAEATYFELGTLVALEHFAREQVELAVLEVGLGGRLDATTAARPRLTAVTRVGMDHMEFLGETVDAIAREKAAIFRKGVPAVVAEQRPEALAAIETCAARVGAPLWVEGRDFSLDGLGRYRGPELALDGLALGLHGEHQHHNAAVAVTCSHLLARQGLAVDAEAIRTGLQRTRWPGRLEQIPGHPPLLLDGAHNEDGVAALVAALDAPPYAGRLVHLVFGVVSDKRVEPMLRALLPRCSSVTLTPLPTPRSLDPGGYLALARAICPVVEVARSPEQALALARTRAGPDGWVLVAGSLYLVGAVKALLEHPAAR
ncbi:MAG TPA: folylpolyglutamate synthase/dihydrofolate synthase family protein [Myxococcaceae bacterium]|nr:folylpolyglutamate synthase/dihydrofolate synthase family protein [Myxococcaceae bacterium]